jgi:hypothetical protein
VARSMCGICRPSRTCGLLAQDRAVAGLRSVSVVGAGTRCPGQPRTHAHFCHAGAFRGLLCLARWCGCQHRAWKPHGHQCYEKTSVRGLPPLICVGDERNLRRRHVTNLRTSTDSCESCRLLPTGNPPVNFSCQRRGRPPLSAGLTLWTRANSTGCGFRCGGQEVVARGHPAFIPRSLPSGPVWTGRRKRRDQPFRSVGVVASPTTHRSGGTGRSARMAGAAPETRPGLSLPNKAHRGAAAVPPR